MTPQQLLEKINSSPFSQKVKDAVAALLNGVETLTLELQGKVQDILQEEIDADFKAAGIDDSDPQVKEVYDQLDKDLAQVEQDLDQDMQFVEGELQELDKMKSQVDELEQ